MSIRFRVLTPAVVAAAAFTLVTGSGLAAEPAQGPAAPAADQSAHERDLLELRTPQHRMFYTLNAQEADRAVSEHGFTRSNEARGLGLYNKKVPNSVAVHRLRVANRPGSYILVSNEEELKTLRESTTDPWDMVDEGVVGYALTESAPGTVALHRFSKGDDRRAARAGRKDLIAAGYRDEGLLGFAPTTDD